MDYEVGLRIAVFAAATEAAGSPADAFMLWSVRISMLLLVIVFWHAIIRAPFTESHPSTNESGQNTFGSKRTCSVPAAVLFISWLMCVIHVLLAFEVRHNWSLAAAEQHTADVTARVTGLHWGHGLYINFAFLAWWAVVACRGMIRQTRPSTAFLATAAFMAFNATAVFGPTWWQPLVAILLFAGAAVYLRRRLRTVHVNGSPSDSSPDTRPNR